MRAILSVLSLVIVVAVIGMVAKKQLQATRALSVVPATASAPAGNVVQQSRQIQQQVRDDVNKLMQQRSEQLESGNKE